MHGDDLIQQSQEGHVDPLGNEIDVNAEVDQAAGMSFQLSSGHIKRNYFLLVVHGQVGDLFKVNLHVDLLANEGWSGLIYVLQSTRLWLGSGYLSCTVLGTLVHFAKFGFDDVNAKRLDVRQD